MNRTDRLVAMVMYLQSHRLIRAEDLAAHFEVSLRTVYRDIAALAESGVPICGEAGVGYSLVKGYHLPPVSFTAEEAVALFLGGELLKRYSDASMVSPAESALLKIRAVLPRDRQDEIDRLSKVLFVGNRMPGLPENKQTFFLPIKRALVERRILKMRYRGAQRSEESIREVEALGLIFGGDLWYLIAWCRLRNEIRHFRLDRIKELNLLPQTFTPRDDFSLEKHLESTFGSAETQTVELLVENRALERLEKESYLPVEIKKKTETVSAVTLQAYSLDWMARWILSFGGTVEAKAPEVLRTLVEREALRLVRMHEKN